MVQSIQAGELTLHDVKVRFDLQQAQDPDFFPEWQVNSSELNEYDRHTLNQAKADFLYLDEYPVHEEIVKMVVLSPLLSVAGFYRRPFRPTAEKQVEIVVEEANEIVRGRIDILVLNQTLWVTVIESKSKRFNVREALPQALFYMLNQPNPKSQTFGLATNGSEFLFIKLLKQQTAPQYGLSRLFSLINPGNELYQVVGILQRLGQLELNSEVA